jgi:hypothetical protein
MKVIECILRYIAAIVISLSIILFLTISLVSSTILNKSYVLSKLEEADYYNKTYEYAESNFENYINQSGLEETVLEDIISKEKVKNDINLIINNIYDGTSEEIDVQEIEDKLNTNIENEIGSKLVYSQKDAINTFVSTISNEYKTTLLLYKYENDINNLYTKVIEYVDLAKEISITAGIISVIILLLLSIKEISKMFSSIGVSFTISGLTFIIINKFIYSKIGVQYLQILNDATSTVLKNTINEILGTVNKYGCIMLVVGIVVIFISNFVHNTLKKEKN